MPHEISWYQEKRIVLNRLIGSLDVEAGTQASEATSQFLNEGVAPVHLIVDMTELKSFPTNITKVNTMNQYLKNPSLGWVVVIGGNTLSQFLVNVLSQVIRFRVAQRPTLEQAVDFLRAQDPSLAVQAAVEK